MREQDIQKQILDWLAARGFLHFKLHMSGVMTKRGRTKNRYAGLPDILGVLRCGTGRMFAIEVKTKKGQLEEKQQEWRARLEAAGVVYLLARSLDDVESVFTAYEEFGA